MQYWSLTIVNPDFVNTLFLQIKSQTFISLPVSKTRHLNKGGFFVFETRCLFPTFQFCSQCLFEFVYTYWLQWWTWTFLIDIIMIISEYHAYKTIWTQFIIKLNWLSAASSYQEWFWVKTKASKQDQAFIFYNAQTPRLIIKTSIYSEETFIWGNTVCN